MDTGKDDSEGNECGDKDAFEDFEFGKFSTSDLINFAFGDDIVTKLEHDLITDFRGKKH